MFITGAFIPMTEGFGEDTVGGLTIKAKGGSVKNLCRHPRRVDSVLEKAWALIPEGNGPRENAQDDDDAFNACDRSSSPAYIQ